MTGLIVLAMWLVGYLAAIHPLYAGFMANQVRGRSWGARTDVVQAQQAVQAAVVASFAALFWPLAVPFFVSRMLRGRASFHPREEVETFKAEMQAEVHRRRQLEAAAVDVESAVDRGWQYHKRV